MRSKLALSASWIALLFVLGSAPAACSGTGNPPPVTKNSSDPSATGVDPEDPEPSHYDPTDIGGPGNLFASPMPDGMDVDVVAARSTPMVPERSIVVRKPDAVDALQGEVVGKLGIHLKRLAKPAIGVDAPRSTIDDSDKNGSRFKADEIGHWVRHPFNAARDEYQEHNQTPYPQRLGIEDNGNPYGHLIDLWGNELDGPNAGVGGGPFRLLAVVNRMDLAGEKDARGIIRAADQPRNFGEARLVFGLVDRDWEQSKGQPYPMTFIIEYRLPALDRHLQPSSGKQYPADILKGWLEPGNTNEEVWRTHMERWALLWRELSKWEQGSPEYNKRLHRIVKLFARPENFTAMRANLKVKDQSRDGVPDEFELREWYMLLNDQWTLIPRKPRDEPYRCIGTGGDLAALIENFWDVGRMDLRMDRVTGLGGGGYNVPRTIKQAGQISSYDWGNPPRGCRLDDGKLPFEMPPDPGDAADPDSVRFTAPFTRVRDNFVWQVADRAGTPIPEQQRHQFAMRTCSGCHSKEAGIFGFQISPRMPGQPAAFSTFLNGADGIAFSNAGHNYDYDELKHRVTYFEMAASRTMNLQPFDGLYRKDEP